MGCICDRIHVPHIDCPKCESGWATVYYEEWCKNFPNDPEAKRSNNLYSKKVIKKRGKKKEKK